MADEMLFWRSWFFPTESSSSDEKDGNVSRFLFSSSSKRLGLEQLPKARPPFPSLSPKGGGGGGGGGAGESGRKPPDLQGEVSPLSWSIEGEMSNPGGLFPDLRKSKNEATNPAFDSESFSSPYKGPKRKSYTHIKHHNCSQVNQNVQFSFLLSSCYLVTPVILTLSSRPSSSTPSLIIWLFCLFLS